MNMFSIHSEQEYTKKFAPYELWKLSHLLFCENCAIVLENCLDKLIYIFEFTNDISIWMAESVVSVG